MKNQSIILSFNSSLGWSPIDRSKDLPDKRGVFETFRLEITKQNRWRGHALQRHFQRYLSGCSLFHLEPITFDKLLEGIQIATKIRQSKQSKILRIRLETIVREGHALVVEDFQPRFKESIGAKLISIELSRTNFLVKYLPATESKISYRYALSNLSDESLLLNHDKLITETSWGNIVVINKNGVMYTSQEALPGITLSLINTICGNKIKCQSYSLKELLTDGSSAFLCNSMHGIIPVKSIDGIELPQSSLIQVLIKQFNEKRSLFEEAFFF